jgi:hypothetical protein
MNRTQHNRTTRLAHDCYVACHSHVISSVAHQVKCAAVKLAGVEQALADAADVVLLHKLELLNHGRRLLLHGEHDHDRLDNFF